MPDYRFVDSPARKDLGHDGQKNTEPDMIEIDGSYGEAGGQILRTALSLSCVLEKPFRMFNIRKGRSKSGLMPQHLMCVRALAKICGASVRGDEAGSMELIFIPSNPRPGDYEFDIGTAGSTSLLLQAVLPPLVFSKKKSSVTLKGGTHVPFSPPFHYISEVFVPTLRRLGIGLNISVESFGFYPKGGGKIRVEVLPSSGVKAVDLTTRGEIEKITGISGVVHLPLSIAERQKNAAIETLSGHALRAEIDLLSADSFGPGTFVFLKAEAAGCSAGFSSLGERGKRAEAVGREAAEELIGYYYTGACLDHHLADQIVLYLAFADGPSSFTTSRVTGHLITNLWATEKFTGLQYSIEGEKGKPGNVDLTPSGGCAKRRNSL
jgi:RNA 3'-terminal phosphate cyclase (ATP)